MGTGGYIGLQADGLLGGQWVGKMAICSIWNAIDIRDGSCEPFGGEGVVFSCRAPYLWQEGDEVRLSVSRRETTPSGTWWLCAVENLRTRAVTALGEIEVKPEGAGLVRGDRLAALCGIRVLIHPKSRYLTLRNRHPAFQRLESLIFP